MSPQSPCSSLNPSRSPGPRPPQIAPHAPWALSSDTNPAQSGTNQDVPSENGAQGQGTPGLPAAGWEARFSAVGPGTGCGRGGVGRGAECGLRGQNRGEVGLRVRVEVTGLLAQSPWDPESLPAPTAPCAAGAAGGAAATGEGLRVGGAAGGRSAAAGTLDARGPPRRSPSCPSARRCTDQAFTAALLLTRAPRGGPFPPASAECAWAWPAGRPVGASDSPGGAAPKELQAPPPRWHVHLGRWGTLPEGGLPTAGPLPGEVGPHV